MTRTLDCTTSLCSLVFVGFYTLLFASLVPAQSYGASCGGQGGQPAINVTPALRPGYTSNVQVSNLPPNRAAMLLFGDSATSWHGVPLPLPLATIGMPGCNLSVGVGAGMSVGTGNGNPSYALPVPLSAALAAHPIYMQMMFEQPGLNAANTGMSRAFAARIAPLPTVTSMVSSITQHGI